MIASISKNKKTDMNPTVKKDLPAIFYKHYTMFVAEKLNVGELARVCGVSKTMV